MSRFLAEFLTQGAGAIAAGVASRQVEGNAGLTDAFEDLRQDTVERLRHLAEAISMRTPELFAEHVRWSKVAFASRELGTSILDANLQALDRELDERAPDDLRKVAREYLQAGMRAFEMAPSHQESPIAQNESAKAYFDYLMRGDREAALQLVDQALANGQSSSHITDTVLVPVQVEIGNLWQHGKMNVADEHFATRVSREVLSRFRQSEQFKTSNDAIVDRDASRRLVTTSVAGELHEFAIEVIADRFEADGWVVDRYGTNVPTFDFIGRAIRSRPHAIAISVSLPTLLRTTQRLIEAIRAENAFANTTIIVGGNPFSAIPSLSEAVGADLSARMPDEAVAAVNERVQFDGPE